VTSLPNVSRDIWQEISMRSFCTSLALFFALWILFPESISPDSKRQSTAGPYGPYGPSCPPRFILRRSVQIAQGLEAASPEWPACCGPPGDELLLSRASRSRGLMLCGLSLFPFSVSLSLSRGPGLEKSKIAKNNIALDGEEENNRIAGMMLVAAVADIATFARICSLHLSRNSLSLSLSLSLSRSLFL